MGIPQGVKFFRGLYELLYEQLTRTLRTLLISPYSPYTPYLSVHSEHSNRFKRVKHFEPLGLLYELKEIDFNALQCVGG